MNQFVLSGLSLSNGSSLYQFIYVQKATWNKLVIVPQLKKNNSNTEFKGSYKDIKMLKGIKVQVQQKFA